MMQFRADLLGVPILRSAVTESTALGAAYLTGLAVGVWPSRDHLRTHTRTRIDDRFDPQDSRDDIAALRARWSDALERAMGWQRDAD